MTPPPSLGVDRKGKGKRAGSLGSRTSGGGNPPEMAQEGRVVALEKGKAKGMEFGELGTVGGVKRVFRRGA
jgi:hypothetical protein